MSCELRNDVGDPVTGIRKLKNPLFGHGFDENGEPKINWKEFTPDFADDNGFDKRNVEENGNYWIKVTLPFNTVLIRYGPETGKFTAPEGTDYDMLSLPYIRESVEFHKYRVRSNDITVYSYVHKGKVAPMFGSSGGAVQFFHPNGNILQLLRKGILERM